MNLRIALTAALIALMGTAYAEHLPGGTITYQCTGSNYYEITLSLYRECSGAPMVPQTLQLLNDCGVSFTIPGLLPIDTLDISPLCADTLDANSCNGGTLIGLQLFIFRTTIYLSPCSSWRFAWSICCRQASVNVANTPGIWVEAYLDNTVYSCDTSPVFNNMPLPFVCVNEPVSYDCGAVDTDGHILRYSFIDARFGSPDPAPVNYQPPYSGAEPFTGMAIDSLTGMITFTPTVQGYVVTAVQVDSYTADGTWVGSVMRDYPFVVRSCSNVVPPIGSGALDEASGGASVIDDHSASICQDGSFCLEATFVDTDAEQSLSLISNVTTVFPGASFDVSGSNPATATICWDNVTAAPGTYYVTVTAMDDACPIRGEQSYLYTITVDGSAPDAGTDAGVSLCSFAPAFALIDSLAGTPGIGGTWTDPNGAAHSGTFDPASDLFGDYTYTIGASPCSGTATLSVALLPPTDPLCVFLGTQPEVAPRAFIAPNPSNGVLTVYGTTASRLEMLDQQGRTVWSTVGRAMNVAWTVTLPASIANGSYFLRTYEGAQIVTYRLEVVR